MAQHKSQRKKPKKKAIHRNRAVEVDGYTVRSHTRNKPKGGKKKAKKKKAAKKAKKR